MIFMVRKRRWGKVRWLFHLGSEGLKRIRKAGWVSCDGTVPLEDQTDIKRVVVVVLG